MVRVTVLTCPVCGAERAFEGGRAAVPKPTLLAAAGAHVQQHALDASAIGLRKRVAVARAEERVVADATALPVDDWTPRARGT